MDSKVDVVKPEPIARERRSESPQSKVETDLKSRFTLPIGVPSSGRSVTPPVPSGTKSPESPTKAQSRIPRLTTSPIQSPTSSPKLRPKSITLYPDSPLSTSPLPSPEPERREFPTKLPVYTKLGKTPSKPKPILHRSNTYTKEMHETDEVTESEKSQKEKERKPKVGSIFSQPSTSFGFPTIPERREKYFTC